MTQRRVGILTIVLAAAGISAFVGTWLWSFAGQDESTVARGRALYAEHCASCHGARLEGQPTWRERLPTGRMPAPPHDASGHTWHHSDRDLFLITKKGVAAIVPGYESDMPGFEGILTDDAIRAVLAFIKSTWPERERKYQDARSRADL